METQGMLVEVIPARVQVALQLVHQYGTPPYRPLPEEWRGVDKFERIQPTPTEKAALDQALKHLLCFIAGVAYDHTMPMPGKAGPEPARPPAEVPAVKPAGEAEQVNFDPKPGPKILMLTPEVLRKAAQLAELEASKEKNKPDEGATGKAE